MATGSGAGPDEGNTPNPTTGIGTIVDNALNPQPGGEGAGGLDSVAENALAEGAEPPNRDGKPGMVVRKDGFVWEWSSQSGRVRWIRLRPAGKADRQRIPTVQEAFQGGDVEAAEGGSPDPVAPSGGGGGRTGGENGAADESDRRDGLYGIAGGSKLWKVGNDHYVVYMVPGTDPPVPMAWKVPNKDALNALTGSGEIKPDRKLTRQEFRQTGRLLFGNSLELADSEGLGDHPWVEFRDKWRSMVRVMPWLADPELQALYASSWMEEQGPPSTEDIRATDWYVNTTDEMRAAAERYGAGGEQSATWKQDYDTFSAQVRDELVKAGFDFPKGSRKRVIDFFVGQIMSGQMTADEFTREVEQASNPYAAGAKATAGINRLPDGAKVVRYGGESYIRYKGRDFAMNDWQRTLYGRGEKVTGKHAEAAKRNAGQLLNKLGERGAAEGRDAVDNLEEVRGLVREWLGPYLMSSWSESQIAAEAQKIAENPAYENELVARLRKMRASAYQGYDPELKYTDIAALGQSQVFNMWGQRMDETDPLFQQVLQMNDAGQAAELLRSKGLERGVRKVVDDGLSGLMQGMGGQIVRSAV